MKKYIFILLVALSAIYCTEEKIPTYHGGHYISFTTDMSKDSTISSFFFYPNATSIEIPLTLQLGGGPLAEDHQYTLAVVEEESNALSKNYQLGTYTFRKGLVQDTAIVTLLKSAELDTKEYTLVLAVQADDLLQPGQTEYRKAKIVFSSMAAQPTWWDATVSKAYLGNYSNKKFQEFIIATDGEAANFGEASSDERRQLALEFLYYLREKKDQGDTVYEEDGHTEMTIPVVG